MTNVQTAVQHSGGSAPPEPRAAGNAVPEFETYRPLLFSIAYRMLGSVMAAEDIVQDAYLRYRGVAAGQIASPRAFLSTIVTRLCLDQLKSARVQREQYIGPWLPEPLITADGAGWQMPEARVEADESVSMAFLVLLERLTPMERAVFLLREVFDFDYDEVATMVERSAGACRQIFRRARQHVAEQRPRFERAPERQQRLALAFRRAVEGGELNELMGLLSEDITVWADGGGKATASVRPLHGRDVIGRFLVGITRKAPAGFQVDPVEVNGSAGFIVHLGGVPLAALVLETDGERICEIRAVANPDKLAHLKPAATPPAPRSGA